MVLLICSAFNPVHAEEVEIQSDEGYSSKNIPVVQKVPEYSAAQFMGPAGDPTPAPAPSVSETVLGEDPEFIKATPDYDPGITEECPHGRRRCDMDKSIDNLENQVKDFQTRYKKGELWTYPKDIQEEKPKKTKYGTKALKYPLLLPVYLTRAITMPIALAADQLIRTGAAAKIVDIVSNDARTFWVYPLIELGFGSGFGGGLGMTHYNMFNSNYTMSGSYVIHINMDQQAKYSVSNPAIFYLKGRAFAFEFVGSWDHRNEAAYYGRGIGSATNSKGYYGSDEIEAGGWFGYEVYKKLLLSLHAYFILDDSRSSSKNPLVQNTVTAPSLVAFRNSLYYIDFGLDLTHDNRNSQASPDKGGKQRFSFKRFQGLGSNNYDYNQFELELLQYIRLWKPRYALVLRTFWAFQQRTGAGIPFYRLLRLDVDSPLRSFPWGRFRDRGVGVANFEFRYPVWEYMDGQIFVDVGRVYRNIKDVSFKHLKYSVGGGFRLISGNYFLLRFQVAYGNEGTRVLFKTSQEF